MMNGLPIDLANIYTDIFEAVVITNVLTHSEVNVLFSIRVVLNLYYTSESAL